MRRFEIDGGTGEREEGGGFGWNEIHRLLKDGEAEEA